jgi:hypothetical protein
MFDFNPYQVADTRRTPEFLARPQQRKIFLLVMMIGGMVLLAKVGVETQFWNELFAPPSAAEPESTIPPQPKYYNTVIRPQSAKELPLETFLAQAEVPLEIDPSAKFFPGVKPALLAEVRDFSPFRAAEHAAWFNLLNVLKEADAGQLKQASTGPVGFVQLYEQMDIYRGQLVTIDGVIKRAFEVQAEKNEFGIEKYYQLWFFPDGGPISPMVIYALELPPEFPLSQVKDDEIQNITENISLTGFAFKNWIYGAKDRIESAPLLLAKSFNWKRPVVVEEKPISLWLIGSIIVATALAALGFTLYVVYSSNKLGAKANPVYAHLSAQPNAEQPLSSAEVGLTLQALAEQVETGQSEDTPPTAESTGPHNPTPDETAL